MSRKQEYELDFIGHVDSDSHEFIKDDNDIQKEYLPPRATGEQIRQAHERVKAKQEAFKQYVIDYVEIRLDMQEYNRLQISCDSDKATELACKVLDELHEELIDIVGAHF